MYVVYQENGCFTLLPETEWSDYIHQYYVKPKVIQSLRAVKINYVEYKNIVPYQNLPSTQSYLKELWENGDNVS